MQEQVLQPDGLMASRYQNLSSVLLGVCLILLQVDISEAARGQRGRIRTQVAAAKKAKAGKKKVVVLVGMPGAGKSTLASALKEAISSSERVSSGKTKSSDSRNARDNKRVIRKVRAARSKVVIVDGVEDAETVDTLLKNFDGTVVTVEADRAERFRRLRTDSRFTDATATELKKLDQKALAAGVGEIANLASFQVFKTPVFVVPMVARVLSESFLTFSDGPLVKRISLSGIDWGYRLDNLRSAAEAVPKSNRARFLTESLLTLLRINSDASGGFVILPDKGNDPGKKHWLAVPSGVGKQPAWLHQVKDYRRLGHMTRVIKETMLQSFEERGGVENFFAWVNLPQRLSMPVLHLHAGSRRAVPDFDKLTEKNFLEVSAKSNEKYRALISTSRNPTTPLVFVSEVFPNSAVELRDEVVGRMMVDAGVSATAAGIYGGRVEVSMEQGRAVVRVVVPRRRAKKVKK